MNFIRQHYTALEHIIDIKLQIADCLQWHERPQHKSAFSTLAINSVIENEAHLYTQINKT